MLGAMKTMALVVALLGAVGCKSGSEVPQTASVKMDSPRATAEGVLLAIKEHNAKLGASLYVTDEQLKKHLDCPDDALAKRAAAKRAAADKDFGEAPKDVVVELAKFDKIGTEDVELRRGDAFEGCKVKGTLKRHKSKLELRSTKEGKTEFNDDAWTFVQFGEEPGWYRIP
jgi:hypothetical protein